MKEVAGSSGSYTASGPSDDPFELFVRTHTATLLRTAYLLTGSGPSAEDLVQDTFVRLLPKWDKVQAADAPVAYVRRSLVNGFLNERRRPSSRVLVLDELPETGFGREPASDIATQVTDRDTVWRLLATLPDRQRAALVMRFFHDLPDEQIADALGCRLGTVRSLVSRGLALMRDELATSSHLGGG